MSKSMYQLFVGNNNIASDLAWKALSETERKALMGCIMGQVAGVREPHRRLHDAGL
jgi:hypothetical protein